MAPNDNGGAYTAVVSGASGFIGTELVKQLLEKGYNVRGTVRDSSNKSKIQHLTILAEVHHWRGYIRRSHMGSPDADFPLYVPGSSRQTYTT